MDTLFRYLGTAWVYLRAPTWFVLGVLLGFGVPYIIRLDRLVASSFAELRFDIPSRVYARPLRLAPGVPLNADALMLELSASRYHEEQLPIHPGSYRRNGEQFELVTRAFLGSAGRVPERRIAFRISGGKIAALVDADNGKVLTEAWVDPARIATYYGADQQERKLVRLNDAPKLLVGTLLAVEDRDYMNHRGLDPWGIMRAAYVDITRGELAQGGSTLTQQLVRNLFLDRGQRVSRKLNEMIMALLMEARFDKVRILEAYMNEVYVGQQGAQAVHGLAAGCEFYFGHDLTDINVQEAALLVGLIQGPSLYDPRRFPERAKLRRDLALGSMEETRLISKMDRLAASRQPLGVTDRGAIERSRYPDFLELVRQQLAQDYPDAHLDKAGFTVLTTLAPSTQALAERAVAEQLKAVEKPKRPLQGALVVTSARSGALEAVVGSREPTSGGFNRALAAARPIGSLVKPFVYLVALAQPERYSLLTPIEDTAVEVPLAGGRVWRPGNNDNIEHGTTLLLDALVHSYNLATVRLGLELDVTKIERVLEALVPGLKVTPNPSLLLGALDLTPLQVAQAYQYLAADGHALPLRSLEAVLDADGRPLRRYETPTTAGDLVAASRLVGFALQETARAGTAAPLVGLGLGSLQVAGKTGTSNDQRDSWFAGYTGSHLAVAWVGTDDNRGTGLYGATGALRVWAGLFQKLPSTPLKIDLGSDPSLAWVDPGAGATTDKDCPGARALPFINGYAPEDNVSCRGGWASEIFGRGDEGRGRFEADDIDPRYEPARPRRDRRESFSQRVKRWFDRRDRDDEEDDDDDDN